METKRKKSEKRRMTGFIYGRCTPAEVDTVKAAAALLGQSVSAYVRETVLAQARTDLEAGATPL